MSLPDPADELLLRIQEIRVNAIIEKKAHYNARSRLTTLNGRLGVASVMASAVSGSSLVATLAEWNQRPAAALALFAAAAAAVLSAVHTFLKPGDAAAGHAALATRYVLLSRACLLARTRFRAGCLDIAALSGQLDHLNDQYATLIRESEGMAPTDADRKRAQRGIKSGEEAYTPEELEL